MGFPDAGVSPEKKPVPGKELGITTRERMPEAQFSCPVSGHLLQRGTCFTLTRHWSLTAQGPEVGAEAAVGSMQEPLVDSLACAVKESN